MSTHPLPTDEQWSDLRAYIIAVCEPVLGNETALRSLQVLMRRNSPGPGHVLIHVTLDPKFVGYLVGRGGRIAEGLRALAKARLRVLGCRAPLDLRVSEPVAKPEHPAQVGRA